MFQTELNADRIPCPLTPNDLYIRRKQFVDVWRNFVHSYSVNCCGLLSCSTLEVEALMRALECTPSTYTDIRRHFVTAHFFHLTYYGSSSACFDYHSFCRLLWVDLSTLPYETNSSCWLEILSVVYCIHVIQTKLMLKIGDIHKTQCLQLQKGPQTCFL